MRVTAGTVGLHLQAVYKFAAAAPTPTAATFRFSLRGGTAVEIAGTWTVDGTTITVDAYTGAGELDDAGLYAHRCEIAIPSRASVRTIPATFEVVPDV